VRRNESAEPGRSSAGRGSVRERAGKSPREAGRKVGIEAATEVVAVAVVVVALVVVAAAVVVVIAMPARVEPRVSVGMRSVGSDRNHDDSDEDMFKMTIVL
jgi:hypothetical protein